MQASSKPLLSAKPVLLIPTVATRTTLAETLESVLPNAFLFERVFISVNGLSSQNVKALIEATGLEDLLDVHLFCTHRFLKAVIHANYIASRMRRLISPNQLIFILSDDDLLSSPADLSAYLARCAQSRVVSVGMGRFATFTEDAALAELPSQNLAPEEVISPLEFLRRTNQVTRHSSISSMLLPFGVFADATKFMSLFGSSGRRTEYLFATHYTIEYLYSPQAPSALIRQHSGQEAATLPYTAFVHDELVFFLWVWINRPQARPFSADSNQYGLTLMRFRSLLLERILLLLSTHAPLSLRLYRRLKLIIVTFLARGSFPSRDS